MFSGNNKTQIVVAAVAVVPPLVARSLWRAPDQTISESIRDARR
jgi:hypothetical protein